MWIAYAFGSALFAGLTSILAKCGIKQTDSNAATALRTLVVLVFSWLMVLVTGADHNFAAVSGKTWCFLLLSGLATGASWLCYFKALQLGEVNKVVPIDKSSTILTILLAIAIGTYLMIQKKEDTGESVKSRAWLVYAILSAVFASLTSILGKVGIDGIDSNFGTAIRTGVVLVMAWVVVFVTGKQDTVKTIPKRELGFLALSGIATGASWLCYYKALKDGLASVVVPIDKLSILVTIVFSYVVFHETLTRKALIGLLLIVGGTLLMLV